VVEELDEPRDHSAIKEQFYFVAAAVGGVGHGPANVDKYIILVVLDEHLGQRRDRPLDLFKGWRGSTSTEIGEGPAGVAHHRRAWLTGVQYVGDWVDCAGTDHHVSDRSHIASDVSETPDRLFHDFDDWRVEKFDQNRNETFLNEHLDVVLGPTGEVREAPRCFELQLGEIVAVQELDESGDQVGVNHRLDGRLLLKGEEASEANCRENLLVIFS